MGYYINKNSNGIDLPPGNKADYIILDGGVEISRPKKFVRNLICVIENPNFDAAGYIYSADEFKAFTDPRDTRPKRWIIHPNAAKLSGYNSQKL
jgi:hypothetical protein